MFYGANAFKHQLGSWNASKAKRQQSMLEHAIAFNQSGLNSTTTGSFNGAIEIEPQQCRWAFVAGVFCAVAVYLCVLLVRRLRAMPSARAREESFELVGGLVADEFVADYDQMRF